MQTSIRPRARRIYLVRHQTFARLKFIILRIFDDSIQEGTVYSLQLFALDIDPEISRALNYQTRSVFPPLVSHYIPSERERERDKKINVSNHHAASNVAQDRLRENSNKRIIRSWMVSPFLSHLFLNLIKSYFVKEEKKIRFAIVYIIPQSSFRSILNHIFQGIGIGIIKRTRRRVKCIGEEAIVP